MKTVTLQVKKKSRPTAKSQRQKEEYFLAAVKVINSHRRNLLWKLELIRDLAIDNPKIWPQLDRLFSVLRDDPPGFKGVAINKDVTGKVFELWMKRFGCRQCGSKKHEHAYRGWCKKCGQDESKPLTLL